ncbi:MAG: nitroreductase [Rikenellaceae bacterium]|nr:nitroreductase [Rikenellaceae bacterium]
MEFKEVVAKRRSIRKFSDKKISEEVVDRILTTALNAPSGHNTRSTRFLVVDNPETIARMSQMRDSGAAFMAGASMAIVVLGDTAKSELWMVNASIAATMLQLAIVDEGLASCWVHIAGRAQCKENPEGPSATDFLREFLPLPEGCEPLCAIALGYSDYQPKPLPVPENDRDRITYVEK